MHVEGVPAEVSTFITDHIESVVQLEALLILQRRPGHEFSPAELGKELAIAANWAEAQLANLCGRGILTCTPGADPRYRYAPRTPDMARAIDGLARAYADRRVTVVSLIFSKPSDQLRSFADAFRLRKDGGPNA